MLLFRSLVIGLIAGCVVLLINMRPKLEQVAAETTLARLEAPSTRARAGVANATLVDVASGVSPDTIASLVHLEAGEHITRVGEAEVDSDLTAGWVIARRAPGRNSYLDLDVAGPGGSRRVLVLFH